MSIQHNQQNLSEIYNPTNFLQQGPWAHVKLLGEYDFSEKKMQDSCGILPTKITS